jgi:RHS repeat-associated protein
LTFTSGERDAKVLPLSIRNRYFSTFATLLFLFLFAGPLLTPVSAALPQRLGDLDGDGKITLFDLLTVINHVNGTVPLSNEVSVFADVNQDGLVDDRDVQMLAEVILGNLTLEDFPLTRVLDSSPSDGATQISVNRETVIHFSQPLSTNTVLTLQNFYAEFGGQKLVTRAELSSDRRRASLFYAYPLPGSARVRVTLNGDTLRDFAERLIDADGDGLPGGSMMVEFETLSQTPLADTLVCGRVFASQLATNSANGTNLSVSTPLAGVTVTADGLEDRVRAVTDQFGDFRLTNAPPGHFFVHIDGHTVTNLTNGIRFPDLAYYPFVGKEWTSIPGGETNIGEIYLPLITSGTLQAVSVTNQTVITFPTNVVAAHPELNGVILTVPPNSLFSNNGERGGSVGIAPVPPDRLPGPLPLGLNFPLVITVQTDGPENFSQPVPVCFPNLPDPKTGQVLPPGAKSALWSFNHDSGQWEIRGSVTISADGKLACSDPGVGILAPGWHGIAPGAPGGGGGPGPGPPPPPPDGCNPAVEDCKCKDPANPTNPVLLYSGEKFEQVVDLRIPGVGFDFVWARTYGSRNGPNTPQGNGWDFSYNVRLESSGREVRMFNGAWRTDLYQPAVDKTNTYSHNGFFRELTLGTNGHKMVLPNQMNWMFHPFDDSPASGKIDQVIDRNGNTMRFAYDDKGALVKISDTLNRDILIAYNQNGFISSVTDFSGRSVTYTYYGDNEAGGSFGDLKSVTSPAVTGTPIANDFPNGKTVSYTYSKGNADERLNHNLLTITDGRRNEPSDPTYQQGPYLVNVYSASTDPNDINFDRVIRQIRGGDIIDLVYVPQLPGADNNESTLKVIIRDRMGNVMENYYNAGGLLALTREFTGRADPTQPTTEVANRPIGKLRPDDPAFFETRCEYNLDSQQTRIVYPNGNVKEMVYEADLNPDTSAKTRGNLRIVRSLPGAHTPAGDQPVLTEEYEYDSGFGCPACGFNFVTKYTDRRGNLTLSQYDDRGNLLARTNRIASIVDTFAYNERGQMTNHVTPDNGGGYHRADAMVYYTSGPQNGYLKQEIRDANTLALATTYEYDAVGNVVRKIDPRGNETRFVVNQLNQVVREIFPEVIPGSGVRYQTDSYYDANNNKVRVDVLNVDDQGVLRPNDHFTTTYEYEILNNLVRQTREVSPTNSVVIEYGYDANRNRNLVRYGEATAGRQPDNVVRTDFDERNFFFREIRAPGASLQSTLQHDYDANGNRVAIRQGTEDAPRIVQQVYDGYNRRVAAVDAMGNTTAYRLDAAGNATNILAMGELLDVPGAANNIRLRESNLVYDELNRKVREDISFFDTATQAPIGKGVSSTQALYSDLSQILVVLNDNAHGKTNRYDTANRLLTATDAKGNTVTYNWDEDSNLAKKTKLEKSDLGGPDELFVSTGEFDGLNRQITTIDSSGNTTRFGYDSRNNLTVEVDTLTNTVRYLYDGLNRLTETSALLTDNGTGTGHVTGKMSTRQVWDDSSRLVAQTDDNGNSTRYIYDGLNRLSSTVYADGTGTTNSFDPHDNVLVQADGNGSIVTNLWDLNNRLSRRDVRPGPGVIQSTTFETVAYDGLGRQVSASNDASLVLRQYDSLSDLTQESQNGATMVCAYDGVGNRLRCAYPGGRVITNAFDPLERKILVADAQGGSIAGYAYVGPARVTQRSYGNGTRTTYQYDGVTGIANPAADHGVQRVIHVAHSRASDGANLDERGYTWDGIYNKRQAVDLRSNGPGPLKNYSYDSVYRLTGSAVVPPAGPAATTSYALDGVGNRTAVAENGSTNVYTMDASVPNPEDLEMNQYSSIGSYARQYDNNSNLRLVNLPQSGRVSFAYDYKNRLVSVTNTALGLVAAYAYDALDRRIQKTITPSGSSPVTNVFFYCDWQEIEEGDGTGQTAATYIYGVQVDELLSVQRSAGTFYFHGDDQYNVRAVSDATGSVVERYDYADYGQPSFYSASGTSIGASAIANAFLFNGHRYDPETGYYNFRTRYLEPSAGRFVNRDTIGVWGDAANLGNAFAFVANNPATMLDPFGTDCCSAAKANGFGGGDDGRVLCCGGTKTPCYFGPTASDQGFNYSGDSLEKCTLEHEKDHIPRQKDCAPCSDPSSTSQVQRRDDVSQKDDECKAYTVGIKCLKNESAKCNKLKGDAKADCMIQFLQGLAAMKNYANNHFGCGIK